MFVRNRTSVPFRVSVHGKKIILEPNTVTFVEDGIISEKQLRDIYGHRIDIVTETGASTAPNRLVPKKAEPVKLTEREEDLTDAALENILKEVNDELEADKEELSEQEIQETFEDIQKAKEEITENEEVTVVSTIEAPVTNEATTVPVEVTPVKASKKGRTRTKKASKKKQD